MVPQNLQYSLYATIRPQTSPERIAILRDQYGVTFLSSEEALQRQFDRVLWFSTHEDIPLLRQLAVKYPTLSINSAAIMGIVAGRQNPAQASPYQQTKLAMFSVPGLYSFVPGLFIEDMPVLPWASRGAHHNRMRNVFGSNFDKDYEWAKLYSVTPKSYLVMCIREWIKTPNAIRRNSPVIVCSDRQYRLYELRRMAGFLPIDESTPS